MTIFISICLNFDPSFFRTYFLVLKLLHSAVTFQHYEFNTTFIFLKYLGAVHMRWTDPARWADFHPAFIGIFYLTAKSWLCHCKKIVLITWLLSGIFILSIWIPEGCNFILLYTVLWIWSLLFLFFCNFMGFYLYR